MKSNRQRRAEIKAKRVQWAIKRQKRLPPKAWCLSDRSVRWRRIIARSSNNLVAMAARPQHPNERFFQRRRRSSSASPAD